ncbi:nucleoid-structuring protein H-NS [bacterium]|nr:nucleoid-structuring protein H-NS [bacterium]
MPKPTTISILDCTLRDGGLAGGSLFTREAAGCLYRAVCDAGLEYIEIGYRNCDGGPAKDGRSWLQCCTEDDLAAITGNRSPGGTKIAVMQDAHKTAPGRLSPADRSAVDLVRIAAYCEDIDAGVRLVNSAAAAGYETSINLMAVSRETPESLDRALQIVCRETDVDILYLVDSYGALLPGDLKPLAAVFSAYTENRRFGMHFHNSRQTAFANTIAGIGLGADIVDTTLLGIGRGAGNCPTELLVDCLASPRYRLEPLLTAADTCIHPLREILHWGYQIPYMLAAGRNLHPGEAIRCLQQGCRDTGAFYRSLDTTDRTRS